VFGVWGCGWWFGGVAPPPPPPTPNPPTPNPQSPIIFKISAIKIKIVIF